MHIVVFVNVGEVMFFFLVLVEQVYILVNKSFFLSSLKLVQVDSD